MLHMQVGIFSLLKATFFNEKDRSIPETIKSLFL